jgi:hypothetical protein
MNEFEQLIQVLQVSADKNGKDVPLTIGHLLNICKKVIRDLENQELADDMRAAYFDTH